MSDMEYQRLNERWKNMHQRCYNKKSPDFPRYGLRGIEVGGWANLAEFMEWSIQNGFRINLTLERKDNSGPYSPENCKWATRKEQARNRRTNTLVTLNGQTKTMAEWIELSGLKSSTVHQRYHAYGWPIEKALNFIS